MPGTTAAAVRAAAGMATLAEYVIAQVTGRAAAALHWCREPTASASIALLPEADTEKKEVTVATMEVEEDDRGMTGEGRGTTTAKAMTATVVDQGNASPQARGTCTEAAAEVRGTTTAAIRALVGMTALAEGATGLATGRASATLRIGIKRQKRVFQLQHGETGAWTQRCRGTRL